MANGLLRTCDGLSVGLNGVAQPGYVVGILKTRWLDNERGLGWGYCLADGPLR